MRQKRTSSTAWMPRCHEKPCRGAARDSRTSSVARHFSETETTPDARVDSDSASQYSRRDEPADPFLLRHLVRHVRATVRTVTRHVGCGGGTPSRIRHRRTAEVAHRILRSASADPLRARSAVVSGAGQWAAPLRPFGKLYARRFERGVNGLNGGGCGPNNGSIVSNEHNHQWSRPLYSMPVIYS